MAAASRRAFEQGADVLYFHTLVPRTELYWARVFPVLMPAHQLDAQIGIRAGTGGFRLGVADEDLGKPRVPLFRKLMHVGLLPLVRPLVADGAYLDRALGKSYGLRMGIIGIRRRHGMLYFMPEEIFKCLLLKEVGRVI